MSNDAPKAPENTPVNTPSIAIIHGSTQNIAKKFEEQAGKTPYQIELEHDMNPLPFTFRPFQLAHTLDFKFPPPESESIDDDQDATVCRKKRSPSVEDPSLPPKTNCSRQCTIIPHSLLGR
jgi:hypothetical protein